MATTALYSVHEHRPQVVRRDPNSIPITNMPAILLRSKARPWFNARVRPSCPAQAIFRPPLGSCAKPCEIRSARQPGSRQAKYAWQWTSVVSFLAACMTLHSCANRWDFVGNHQARAASLVAQLHRPASRAVQYPCPLVLVILPELENAIPGWGRCWLPHPSETLRVTAHWQQ